MTGACVQKASFISYEKRQGDFFVLTDQGAIRATFLVFCAHQAMQDFDLLPDQSWVSYQDQWVEVTSESNVALPAGSLVSYRHHLDWALVAKGNTLFLGGGRFLRRLAGIGFRNPEYLNVIEEHQIKTWQSLLG